MGKHKVRLDVLIRGQSSSETDFFVRVVCLLRVPVAAVVLRSFAPTVFVFKVRPVLPVRIEVTSIASPVFSSMYSLSGVSDQASTDDIRINVLCSA